MAVGRIRLELIENRGPNTLLAALRTLLKEGRVVELQVAFVSAEGVGTLLPHLLQAAARGKVRIATGLYQAVTEPSALWLLLKAQRQTKGRLEARLARDTRFHRKLYLITAGRACSVISGSSNLTAEGLKSGGEFNVLARLPVAAPQVRRLVADFKRLWSKRSVPLSGERIRRYQKVRPPRQRHTVSARSLAQVLGGADSGSDRSGTSGTAEPRYWRDWVDGKVDRSTKAIVQNETDWERKRYDWYACHFDGFQIGDRILVFDHAKRWAEVGVVKDTARMPGQTPDGRHFAAFVRAPGCSRRRMNARLWKTLATVGLPIKADDRTKRRRLTEGQWGRVASVFQK